MKALLTASFLLAALLGTADPPDLLTPTGPPEPRPCTAPTPCPPATTPPSPVPRAEQGTTTPAPVNSPGDTGTNWWLTAVPILALLALAAAAVVLLLQRTDRRP